MAKLTIEELKEVVETYIGDLQAQEEFEPTFEAITGLLNKIGKQLNLNYSYRDKLDMFTYDELKFGKIIEEWFSNAFLPEDFAPDGEDSLAPSYPTYQAPVYSYPIGKKTLKTTEAYERIQSAMLGDEEFAEVIAQIYTRLGESKALLEYFLKLELVKKYVAGVFAGTANALTMAEVLPIPTDTASGEDFIKSVKEIVERVSLPTEEDSINGNLAQVGAEGLTLILKAKVLPSLEVDTLAGAFNESKLAFPVNVIMASNSDLGANGAYALLVDTRALRLHPTSDRVVSAINAKGDFVNFYRHVEYTAHYSPNAVAHVWHTTAVA